MTEEPCEHTPYTPRTSPYSAKANPFSEKSSPFSAKANPFETKSSPYDTICLDGVILLKQGGSLFTKDRNGIKIKTS